MSETSYWSNFTVARRSRRRLLAGALTGAAGITALALAGCGGGDGDDKPAQERGLLTPLKDRSSEAVPGGRYVTNASNIPQVDPIGSPSTLTRIALNTAFTRLFKIKPGLLEPSKGDMEGDLAESWELSNGGLQLTIKLRKNAGTDPRPPVNGRVLDAQDVLYSWKRFGELSTLRFSVLNSLDPNAPVESVTAPDSSTVVFKFAFPSVITMTYLIDGFYFWVIPKEAESRYDARNEAHGAGPYYLDEFVSGNRVVLKKNPNYYDKPRPYLDELQFVLLSEPAALLAQFEAKTITDNGGVTTENIVDVYKRHPEMIMYEDPLQGPGAMIRIGFSEDSPWRDVRLRRAASMSFNRPDLAEYFTNSNKLTSQGLPSKALWTDHVSAMFPGVSLDPEDTKTYGPNSQYFHYNVAEAKKLVAAAGFTGKTINLRYDMVSAAVQRNGQVFADQLRQAGWAVNEEVVDRDSYYLPKVNRGRGNFEGLFHENYAYQLTPESFIYSSFHPASASTLVREGDFAKLTEQLNAIAREFDSKKRIPMVQDFARQAAADMPGLPVGSLSPAYRLAWPWIANIGVLKWWAGGAVAKNSEILPRFWFDKA
ncbi:MAG TPA: ABC transporter substrate-binding protein, partial [Dehalococcoidia bacterium]|nr:ABC transporter substrate-binding protein [Dehalococcoidia bacterium]